MNSVHPSWLAFKLPPPPENGSCDLSVLMECRRNKSLILLRDRTERERDELRAACRRRREEAAVRGNIWVRGCTSREQECIQVTRWAEDLL